MAIQARQYTAFETSCAHILLSLNMYDYAEKESIPEIEKQWALLNTEYQQKIKFLNEGDPQVIAFQVTEYKVQCFFKECQSRLLQTQNQPVHQPQIPATIDPLRQLNDLSMRSQNEGVISFYDDTVDPLTGCFGNFHICPKKIEFGGKYYSNAEAIFQAQKFTDNKAVFNQFNETIDGAAAVILGQTSLSPEKIKSWDNKKIDVMMNALHAKFSQNSHLKSMLLATKNAYLIEHLPGPQQDKFWGDAHDGSGPNHLGQCLMKLRAEYGGTGIVARPPHDRQKLEKCYAIPNPNQPIHLPQAPVYQLHPPASVGGPLQQLSERAKSEGVISFYDDTVDALTGCFGNFHICPKKVEFGRKHYSNAEALFQAQKFTDNKAVFNQFDENIDGAAAVILGQTPLSPEKIKSWDNKKIDVMMNALRAKYGQNPELKSMLLATGNAYLIEHLPGPRRDKFWTDAYDGTGPNHLGQCLMRLRAEYGGTGIVTRPPHDHQKLEKFYVIPNHIIGITCKVSNCTRSVFQGTSFCGKTHAEQYKSIHGHF